MVGPRAVKRFRQRCKTLDAVPDPDWANNIFCRAHGLPPAITTFLSPALPNSLGALSRLQPLQPPSILLYDFLSPVRFVSSVSYPLFYGRRRKSVKMSTPTPFDHLSNRMKLEWHSKLHTDMAPAKNYRRTSIIGTIGMLSHRCHPGLSLLTRNRFQVPRQTRWRRSTCSAKVRNLRQSSRLAKLTRCNSRSECRPDELFPRFIRGSCHRLLSPQRTRSLTPLPQYHQSVIDNAREAERIQPGRPLAIALDTVSSVGLGVGSPIGC